MLKNPITTHLSKQGSFGAGPGDTVITVSGGIGGEELISAQRNQQSKKLARNTWERTFFGLAHDILDAYLKFQGDHHVRKWIDMQPMFLSSFLE